jgi:hypothetical protein
MIYEFRVGNSLLCIGVRGFIAEGLPRIAPAC